jgi:hypothetical protein
MVILYQCSTWTWIAARANLDSDEKSKVINLSFFKLTSNKLFETLMFIIENGFILYFIATSIERILILLSDILNVLEMCYNYKSFYYTFFLYYYIKWYIDT